MKRIIYILTTIAAAVALTACGPKEDERMIAMDGFMDAQDATGLYVDSKVEYAFNKATNQASFSRADRTYCIMNDAGDKFLQFTLSADPVVGQTVDVEATSRGLGLSSKTTYKGMIVDKIENNLCHLRSTAEGGYVGIIIAWID